MKLEEIKKVIQTTDVNEVNLNLKKDYEVIRIFNSRVKTQEIEQAMPIYILATKKG